MTAPEADLTGWVPAPFTGGGFTHDVYRKGTGPGNSRHSPPPGNAHGFSRMAHSVLTDQVREADGHPAYEARKRVVEFLTQRLMAD